MVLGYLGADVIKVEPPTGSPSRTVGPFLDDAPQQERSLQYFAFNRNKRSICLDREADAGRPTLSSLAEKADSVIESAPPGDLAGWGLGFEAMRQAHPCIFYVAITPLWLGRASCGFPSQRSDNCGHGRSNEPARASGFGHGAPISPPSAVRSGGGSVDGPYPHASYRTSTVRGCFRPTRR